MSKSKTKSEDKKPTSREANLAKFLRKISGDGTMLMSDGYNDDIQRRSSGVLSLDIIIGGGYPHGRVIEIFGPESSGKTTLTLHAIESVQRNDGMAFFIDAEHALDTSYASDLGVDISKLIINQPSCGEEALELINSASPMMKPGDLIVVDSVAALTPKAEIDGEMGGAYVGAHARLMGQAMRKLVGNLSKSGVIVIFVNQIRHKIGVIYGSNETTTGGEALKFYSSIRIETRKSAVVKKGNEVIGNGVRLKCIKNKVFPPHKIAETTIRYGKGIPRNVDILTVAGLIGLVSKGNGGWLSYDGNSLGQGIDSVALSIDSKLLEEIEQKILECYNITR